MSLLGDTLSIAAVNGPSAVVVSGPQGAVAAVERHFRSLGRKAKRLAVSHAFHSALMKPMLAEFGDVAKELSYAPPTMPVVSMTTGRPVTPEAMTSPEYWVRHVVDTVQFCDTAQWLAAHGARTFIEMRPDAALSATGPAWSAETPSSRPEPSARTSASSSRPAARSPGGAHAGHRARPGGRERGRT